MKLDPLVGIIPNISEGRNPHVVRAIADSLVGPRGVWLLDVHSDPSHNRSVLTAVARPDAVTGAATRLVFRAIELIDLTAHEGEHPCVGAIDVLPFVALRGLPPDQMLALVRETARTISASFELPVFLYADSRPDPDRGDLAQLRRGGFEALAKRMASGELVADYGPRTPHPTAGATAVGARNFLIAYNVNLRTKDVEVARAVRASNGGLPHVQALGFELAAKGFVQVSMNLTDFRVTSLSAAFRAVKTRAAQHDVEVAGSEIVGLVPRAAVFENMVERLALDSPPGILEEKLSAIHLIP